MRFTELISQITSFVNLGKIVVDGGPGVLLAVALSIIAASVAQLPILPYTEGPIVLVESGQIPSDTEEKTADEAAPPEDKVPRYERGLQDLVAAVSGARQKATELAKEKAAVDSEVQVLTAELARLEEEFKDLRGEQAERAKSDVFDVEESELEQEIEALRTQIETEARPGEPGVREQLRESLQEQSRRQRELTELDAEIARLTTEFEVRSQEKITNLQALFAYLLDNLIGLALVGWVLGTLLSPFNRALLAFGTKSSIGHQRENQVEELRPELKKAVREPSEKEVEKRLADKRGDEGPSDDSARKVTDGDVKAELKAEFVKDNIEELKKLMGRYSPSYFIGRKIISRTEWDELVSAYYRWAEVSNNLIVPLLVLSFSFLWLLGESTQRGEGVAIIVSGLVGALLLGVVVLIAKHQESLFIDQSTASKSSSEQVRSSTPRDSNNSSEEEEDNGLKQAKSWLWWILTMLFAGLLISLIVTVALGETSPRLAKYVPPYLTAAMLCWVLASLAWYSGRKAYFSYRRRQTEFILGRLVKVTLDAQKANAAKSLEEVAEQTVANLKALLEEVKKQRDLVKKEIFAKLKEWLDEQTHGPEISHDHRES